MVEPSPDLPISSYVEKGKQRNFQVGSSKKIEISLALDAAVEAAKERAAARFELRLAMNQEESGPLLAADFAMLASTRKYARTLVRLEAALRYAMKFAASELDEDDNYLIFGVGKKDFSRVIELSGRQARDGV